MTHHTIHITDTIRDNKTLCGRKLYFRGKHLTSTPRTEVAGALLSYPLKTSLCGHCLAAYDRSFKRSGPNNAD